MAHTVHTTHALVLGSSHVQDADKLLWLLTEDLGLLFASAKSVREEVSKLRYALQDLSYSRVSLVRGRGLWRLTGAEIVESTRLPVDAAVVLGRITTLARRVVPTEEENKAIFTIVHNTQKALSTVSEKQFEVIEQVSVARILYQLGYVSCTSEYQGVVDTTHISNELLERAALLSRQLLDDINIGLSESQL